MVSIKDRMSRWHGDGSRRREERVSNEGNRTPSRIEIPEVFLTTASPVSPKTPQWPVQEATKMQLSTEHPAIELQLCHVQGDAESDSTTNFKAVEDPSSTHGSSPYMETRASLDSFGSRDSFLSRARSSSDLTSDEGSRSRFGRLRSRSVVSLGHIKDSANGVFSKLHHHHPRSRSSSSVSLSRNVRNIQEIKAAEAMQLSAEPLADDYKGEDGNVDWVLYLMAYLLYSIEPFSLRYLDDRPVTKDFSLREFRAGFERCYTVVRPLIDVARQIRDVCYWKERKTTIKWLCIYTALVYFELVMPFIFLILMCRIRKHHVSAEQRAKDRQAIHLAGKEAEEIGERMEEWSYRQWALRFRNELGPIVQGETIIAADLLERFKNLIEHRTPQKSRQIMLLLGVTFVASFFLTTKVAYFAAGIWFFFLLPVQHHYPRYRKVFMPFMWLLWDVPTDAEYEIARAREQRRQFGYEQYHRYQEEKMREGGIASALLGVGKFVASSSRPSSIAEVFPAELEPSSDSSAADDVVLQKYTGWSRRSLGTLSISPKLLSFKTTISNNPDKQWTIPVQDIVGVKKNKSVDLVLTSTKGLVISTVDGKKFKVDNMIKRDDAFHLLASLSSKKWI